MAIFSMNIKMMSKSKGHSASAKYKYIMRQGKTKKEDLVFQTSGNMPNFAKNNPRDFWQNADIYERKNGTLGRSLIIALPQEFDLTIQVKMIDLFIQHHHINQDNLPFSYAIHNDKNNNNPHLHLIFSERKNLNQTDYEKPPELFFRQYSKKSKDPKTRGTKKLNIGNGQQRKDFLKNTRELWQNVCNAYLQQANLPLISCKSHQDQGIDQTPGQHQGMVGTIIKQAEEEQKRLIALIAEQNNIIQKEQTKQETKQVEPARKLSKLEEMMIDFTIKNKESTPEEVQIERKEEDDDLDIMIDR